MKVEGFGEALCHALRISPDMVTRLVVDVSATEATVTVTRLEFDLTASNLFSERFEHYRVERIDDES